jgi:chromosome segregation ATPase
VSKLASAEGEMQSLSAVAAARVEALAAAAKRGKELARAQKEVQKALGAPQREDPGRALVLLREEVRVLRERHGKVRGQAEAQEKDVTNHQARMAEVQAEVDDYTRRLAELQGQIRLRQEAVDRETAGGEAGLKLRDLERQVAEEDGAAARERAEQRVKMNDLVGEIKRERGRVEAAARIARNVEEELRELELKKKQRERARRDARTAGRAAAEAERAEAEAADAHAVSLLRAAALSPKKRTPAAKPARASVSVKSLKGEEAAAETLSGAVVEPGETASSDRSASRLSGRVEAAGSSRGGEGAQAPSSRLGSRGGGDDGSDGGLDLPELDEEEVKPQREHEHLRGDFARTSSRGEDQDHAAGVTYTTALDDFDEESDREEDVL